MLWCSFIYYTVLLNKAWTHALPMGTNFQPVITTRTYVLHKIKIVLKFMSCVNFDLLTPAKKLQTQASHNFQSGINGLHEGEYLVAGNVTNVINSIQNLIYLYSYIFFICFYFYFVFSWFSLKRLLGWIFTKPTTVGNCSYILLHAMVSHSEEIRGT